MSGEAAEIEKVTEQPETLLLNKYFGFKQLDFLSEKGISCVKPLEIVDYNSNDLTSSKNNSRWTVRVAAITGNDFDLPSILGVDANEALEWINNQHAIDDRYVFFCSEYFKPVISGRMHIRYFSTVIEMSTGDFLNFKHSVPEFSATYYYNKIYENAEFSPKFTKEIYMRVLDLSKNLKLIYRGDFISMPYLIHEYDFAFIPHGDDLELKIVGMRTDNEKYKGYLSSLVDEIYCNLSKQYENDVF